VIHNQEATWPAGEHSKEYVENYCNSRIKEGNIGKQCGNITGVNVEIEVKSCIEDIKVIYLFLVYKKHINFTTGAKTFQ